MRGHLGFKVRPCVRPAPPVLSGGGNTGLVSWTVPNSYGRPITGYKIELRSNFDPGWFVDFNSYVGANTTTYYRPVCHNFIDVRVSAITACGIGDPSNVVRIDPFLSSNAFSAVLYTESGENQLPCGVTAFTAYCIGRGGFAPNTFTGGNGGGLAYKTWTNNNDASVWLAPTVSWSISPSQSSVTFGGVTIYATAATTSAPGAYGSSAGFSAVSGHGGSYGGSGNLSDPPQTSTAYMYGGSIGGGLSAPSLASPCKRMPAFDRGGLMAAVALAGGKATEDCSSEAAFGSGASRFPYPAYSASALDYSAGYGGGGFDTANPPGAGCVVLRFNG